MNELNRVNLEEEQAKPVDVARGQVVQAPGFLVLSWSVWLLGSWVVALMLDPSIRAVRWMVFSCLFGLMVLWPVVRLSQGLMVREGDRWRVERASRWRALLDWVVLYAVFQAVVWPLRVSTDWSFGQVLQLDLAVGVWSLFIAAVVSLGCRMVSGWGRVGVMIFCVLVLVGEPVILAWMNVGAVEGESVWWKMVFSPLEAVWSLTGPGIEWIEGAWRDEVVMVGVLAGLLWIWVLINWLLDKKSNSKSAFAE